jgi:ribosomal protein S18 acetylase RimI-like enzyme
MSGSLSGFAALTPTCGVVLFQEISLTIIRKANRSDAKQLAQLAERTFRDTFAATNTAEDMDSHCRVNYGESAQAGEIENPGMVTVLCEEGERLIGFAQLRWGDAPDCVLATSPGEIQRLYVARDWHGKGVAQDLMRVCIQEMHARGSDFIWLGVWEQNPRAIAFYRKFGFIEVGEHVFPLGSDPQRDIVMARSLAG